MTAYKIVYQLHMTSIPDHHLVLCFDSFEEALDKACQELKRLSPSLPVYAMIQVILWHPDKKPLSLSFAALYHCREWPYDTILDAL